ncbi:S-layer homology domain-containing protein [Syntrophomonas curvata]
MYKRLRDTLIMTALALVIVAGILFKLTPTASAADTWDGSSKTAFTVGNGSALAPYQIATGAQLAYLAEQVNLGQPYTGEFFKLTDDINLNNHPWTPIGTGNSFGGIFDGNGKIISNLMINSSSAETIVGLFGYIDGATINKVGVENVVIDSSPSNSYVGGLAGGALSSNITNSYATGIIKGVNEVAMVGGLVGYINGSIITNSYATASVECGINNGKAGGLTGFGEGSSQITNSYATGNVKGGTGSYAGGLLGVASGCTITSSYATGGVTGAAGSVGGLAGGINPATITNCYWNSTAIATGVGAIGSDGISTNDSTGKPSVDMTLPAFVIGLNAGGTAWKADTEGKNSGYPVLDGVGVGIQTGTTIDSIVCTSPASSITNAASVTYRAAFGKGVTGVSTSNFDLNPTVTGASINSVSVVAESSNAQWDITVNTGTGDGALTPRLVNDTGLSLSITTVKPYSNQSYTIDKTPPAISIGAPSAALTSNGPVTYTVTYSDANFNASTLAVENITLNRTGNADGTLGVNGTGLTRTVTISGITGNGTLGISIAAGTASDMAGNAAPGAGPSTTFTVENTPPNITTQPDSSTVTAGNNASFTVAATGTGLTYQWQVNTGSGFSNIADGGVYSNATTATLNITGATAAMNGYQYRVIITGTVAPSATSNAAALTVNSPPAITGQPGNATVTAGNNASFTVAATGTGLTYQWQVNTGSGFGNIADGGVYSNATTATLNITGATAAMNGYQYRVIITGTVAPSATSNAAALTVNSPPAITGQPGNATVTAGNNTSFTVAATGTGLTYQWQVNTGSGFSNIADGGVYSNATTATLNITGATAAMNGYQYRVIITGTVAPSATSNAAALTVNSPPAITGQPGNATVTAGNNASFTVAATGTGLTYQWQVNTGSGFSNIADGGVYSNATTATLNITGATAAMNGYQYRVIITGTVAPSATSNAAALTVNSPPAITGQPGNATVTAGNNASFTVAATGTGLTYQWQVNTGSGFGNIADGGVYSNATTATLNITGATAAMNGYQYRCVVTDAGALSSTSGSAALTVNSPPAITGQPSNASVNAGNNTSFTVAATGTGLTYQWQVNTGSGFSNIADGGVYSNATTATLNITGATAAMNGYQYRVIITGTVAPSATSNAAALTVNSPPAITGQPGNASVNAGNNTSFTVVATGTGLTYQWQVNTGSGFSNIADGGVYSNATTATLNITGATAAMNGYIYRCVVTDAGTLSSTSGSATLTVNRPPAITGQPGNATVNAGNNASFTVAATGTGLTYQWQVNTGSGFSNIADGGVYSNATTATLNITGATAAMNGYQYRVIITGTAAPSATSNAAALTVSSPPAITGQPGNASVNAGNNTSFTVVATGTGLTYQWQVNTGSGFSNIADGGVYSNATTATLNITGATAAMNGYIYRCVVTDAGTLSSTSGSATLTVNRPPAITGQPGNATVNAGNNASFTVAATGTGLTYQWQVNTGSGFSNIADGGVYSNATTATLNITGATAAMNGYQYRVIITGTAAPSATSNAAALTVSSTFPGGGSNSSTATPAPITAVTGADIQVNGHTENAGIATTSKQGDQTVTILSVNPDKLQAKLEAEGSNAVVTIPVMTGSDIVVGELTGQMVKNMENKQAILEVKTDSATYILPAQQIRIDEISAQFASNVELKDIKVQIQMATPAGEIVKVVENSARTGEFTIVAPPIEFNVRCTFGNKTVSVNSFNSYVERTVAIPEGVDPSKITTGVVIEADGSVRPVPTRIVQIDGKYYAKINSLTNSTYLVIWHPIEFKDVDKHWAKTAVNDMGSRMVISGVSKGSFEPDRDITRAEFASIVVRALGLKPGSSQEDFSDVQSSDWYSGAIQTASQYKIISGYGNGKFGPTDKVTREQAMTMIAKAMNITGLKVEIPSVDAEKLLAAYVDADKTAEYAKISAVVCIKTGIISGKGTNMVAPKDNITRAEVAVIIQKLLQKSSLI